MTGFAAFYEGVHGYEPFPWQSDLAADVLRTGRYPDVGNVPTGLGKTSLIDIAVWVAAQTRCEPGSAGRRRTFFVIDRRIVVDEAHRHAKDLGIALCSATEGPVAEVAAALRELAGLPDGEDPLVVERMRGGISWDWRWLDRPDRAAVVVGTVDQLGSRLFFRGYGVGQTLAPIDAALVGTDSLFVVDEAHLSAAFLDSVDAARRLDKSQASSQPIVVAMSATVSVAGTTFTISDADRAHPVAARRLAAPKAMHLVEVPGPVARRAERTAQLLAETGVRLLAGEGRQAVGIICNTVGRARATFEHLKDLHAAGDGPAAHLLTGRIRPFDRNDLQVQLLALAAVGRTRADLDPVIVVATQTVEVGANLDFDALVTESTSWDSLVQRLGRLNRLGVHEEAAPAVVVHDDVPSLLYGEAREQTWAALVRFGELTPVGRSGPELGDGFGASPDELAELGRSLEPGPVSLQPGPAPIPDRAVLDAWVRTSPRDRTDPPVAPYLHGYGQDPDQVRLVWRSDLPEGNPDLWAEVVERRAPVDSEVLEVPRSAFARWVQDRSSAAGEVADLPRSITVPEAPIDGQPAFETSALYWPRGDIEAPEVIRLPEDRGRVKANSLLVLPSSTGGCDRYGWAPTSTGPVPDLGDLAGQDPALRLAPTRTLSQTLQRAMGDLSDPAPMVPDLQPLVAALDEALETTDPDPAQEALAALMVEIGPKARFHLLGGASGGDDDGDRGRLSIVVRREHHGIVAIASLVDGARRGRHRRQNGDADADGTSLTGEVTLAQHCTAVAERAANIAGNLGLDDQIVVAVSEAAAWHDVGKLDPRFQTMLHGGDRLAAEVAMADGRPLAKSAMNPDDWLRRRDARRASGLPFRFRHEVGSARAVRVHVAGRTDLDPDLVEHLVGAHHGRGRPLYPGVVDEADPLALIWQDVEVELDRRQTVDWSGPARFELLNARYGRWRLALLEAIVRLADIGCSEEGT